MVKLIVVLIIMIIALWQLKGFMEGKVAPPGKEDEAVPTQQEVKEFKSNYKETFHEQMLVDEHKKREEQMKKALDEN